VEATVALNKIQDPLPCNLVVLPHPKMILGMEQVRNCGHGIDQMFIFIYLAIPSSMNSMLTLAIAALLAVLY
jgi:hypothetical protein